MGDSKKEITILIDERIISDLIYALENYSDRISGEASRHTKRSANGWYGTIWTANELIELSEQLRKIKNK